MRHASRFECSQLSPWPSPAVLALPAVGQAVMFPDKNLEAALRALVFEKKNNTEELTDDDLRKISTLEAKGSKIQNLAGLEKCTNLLLLDLSNNEIADLAPIRGLARLQSLSLAQNKIADITPLMDLNKLQYLNLSNNQIRGPAAAERDDEASALYLAENQIDELAPLAGLAGSVVARSGEKQDRRHQAAGRHRPLFGA